MSRASLCSYGPLDGIPHGSPGRQREALCSSSTRPCIGRCGTGILEPPRCRGRRNSHSGSNEQVTWPTMGGGRSGWMEATTRSWLAGWTITSFTCSELGFLHSMTNADAPSGAKPTQPTYFMRPSPAGKAPAAESLLPLAEPLLSDMPTDETQRDAAPRHHKKVEVHAPSISAAYSASLNDHGTLSR